MAKEQRLMLVQQYKNVPYVWINKQKWNQHWLRKGEKFYFPGGGKILCYGVSTYVDLMKNLIPQIKDVTFPTSIDYGSGVANWGGDLIDRVSLALKEDHEAQVS